jgi:hypothetical protein
VSRPKVTYAIEHAGSGEILSQHRTRQGAIDAWRLQHAAIPVQIWRRSRHTEERGLLIVEGTWHEPVRPDGV